jgi:Ni,Fe-hydrogenase I large subunit
VRAVEDALGVEIPNNARILRNIIEGIQYVQDHVVHFYHLHALDWVDITQVLNADPAATAQLAQSISDYPKSSEDYFQGVKNRIAAFVESGQLGPFANAYWGHSAYKLPPEANLMAVAHYLEALDWQRDVIRAHAILGAKNPNLQTYLVGGMATPIDPESQHALNAGTIAQLQSLFATAKQFVDQVYLPDVLAVAPFYLEWAGYGEGLGNFLSYGDWPDANGKPWLPPGYILNRDLSTVHPVNHQDIVEYVTRSWYDYDDDSQGKHPWDGETRPNYTGPQPPYEFLNTDEKYTWMKAPRLNDEPMEVGPLARNKLAEWTGELATSMANRDFEIHEWSAWNPEDWPADAQGWGFTEAPRGALGHWIHIKDQKIHNYQAVVPSTWNCSPRDAQGKMGAYEAALIGTPVADPEKPLEVLRTIHSFDPCMACGVHVLDAQGREITQVVLQATSKC